MKTCVVVLGKNEDMMRNAAHEIAEILVRDDKPHDEINIVCMSLNTLNCALKYGAPMPTPYLRAEKKLLMGIDGGGTAYLEQIMAEIERTKNSTQKEVEFLRMSEVVLAECRRRGIRNVYVHEMPEAEIDPQLLHRLRNAGMQACRDDTRVQNDIDMTLAAIVASRSNEQSVLMANRLRNQLSYLANQMGFQVALFGWRIPQLWEAEKLSRRWGPELMDGYKLYLKAAANWIRQTSKINSAPPHSLT